MLAAPLVTLPVGVPRCALVHIMDIVRRWKPAFSRPRPLLGHAPESESAHALRRSDGCGDGRCRKRRLPSRRAAAWQSLVTRHTPESNGRRGNPLVGPEDRRRSWAGCVVCEIDALLPVHCAAIPHGYAWSPAPSGSLRQHSSHRQAPIPAVGATVNTSTGSSAVKIGPVMSTRGNSAGRPTCPVEQLGQPCQLGTQRLGSRYYWDEDL